MDLFKRVVQRLKQTPFVYAMEWLYSSLIFSKKAFCKMKWSLQGHKKPSAEDARLMAQNVTVIFKSFER